MVKKQVVYFDALNVLACFCVIAMHCSGIVYSFSYSKAWTSALFTESFACWAVPVFFMLSGATLMNYRKRYSTTDFLKRRISRVGIPLIFWSAVFLALKIARGEVVGGKRAFLNMLMNFEIEPVFWFFGPLLMLYLAMPVLSCLAENKKLLQYMAGLGILTYSAAPFVCRILGLSYNSHFYFPLTGGYVLYALLGYLLAGADMKPWQRSTLYILALAGGCAKFFHTWVRLKRGGVRDTLTWNDKFLPVLLLSVGVFVLAKYLFEKQCLKKEWIAKSLRWLSGASFGIYLIHVFVMHTLQTLLQADTASALWRFLGPIAIYLLCLAVVQIVKKIPLGKYIFP